MYKKTNLKEEGTLISCNSKNNSDGLYLDVYFNLRVLNEFIDERIAEFSTFSIDNESFKSKSRWLDNWKDNRKKEVFADINQVISSGNLENEKLIRLNKRIERYFKYFDLIDEENNVNYKYEEVFNTIVQIPSEIYSFIKKGIPKQDGKFMKNEYSYSENQISSSIYAEDDILNLVV